MLSLVLIFTITGLALVIFTVLTVHINFLKVKYSFVRFVSGTPYIITLFSNRNKIAILDSPYTIEYSYRENFFVIFVFLEGFCLTGFYCG